MTGVRWWLASAWRGSGCGVCCSVSRWGASLFDEAVAGYECADLFDLLEQGGDFHVLDAGQRSDAVRCEFEEFVEISAVCGGQDVVGSGGGCGEGDFGFLCEGASHVLDCRGVYAEPQVGPSVVAQCGWGDFDIDVDDAVAEQCLKAA